MCQRAWVWIMCCILVSSVSGGLPVRRMLPALWVERWPHRAAKGSRRGAGMGCRHPRLSEAEHEAPPPLLAAGAATALLREMAQTRCELIVEAMGGLMDAVARGASLPPPADVIFRTTLPLPTPPPDHRWRNPVLNRSVDVKVSGVARGTKMMVVDHTYTDQVFYTDNREHSYVQVALLDGVSARPTHYSFAQRDYHDYFPRSWAFAASKDGVQFETLATYANDETFSAEQQSAAFAVAAEEYYSHFRITLDPSGNSHGSSALVVSCFELYGDLRVDGKEEEKEKEDDAAMGDAVAPSSELAAAPAAAPVRNPQYVYSVRHGHRMDDDPKWESDRPYDPPLTDEGHATALAVGKELAALPAAEVPDVIIASPFTRCLETAVGLAKGLGLASIGVHYQLGEVHDPRVLKHEGAPVLSPPAELGGIALRVLDTTAPAFPESHGEAYLRYAAAFDTVPNVAPTQNVALVTHGEAVGQSVASLRPELTVYSTPYCCYTVRYREAGEGWQLRGMAESNGKVEWMELS